MRSYRIHYRKGPRVLGVDVYTTRAHNMRDAWCRADKYLSHRYPNYILHHVEEAGGLTLEQEIEARR